MVIRSFAPIRSTKIEGVFESIKDAEKQRTKVERDKHSRGFITKHVVIAKEKAIKPEPKKAAPVKRQRKQSKNPGPRLRALLDSGVAWKGEFGEYNAKAADGIEVCLGSELNHDTLERYLEANPGPLDW